MPIKSTVGIIFAAGRGTRMAPFTDTTPKPLAKINGISLLEINLAKISPLVSSFVIVVGWLKEQIQAEIGESFDGKKVVYATQENPKGGTLDALRIGIESIFDENANFLVTNSDNICGKEFYDSLKKKIDQNPNLAYLSAKNETNLEIVKSSGVFVVDEKNRFISIVEKPAEFVSSLINIGLYYLPSQIQDFIPAKRVTDTQSEELITDLFNLYAKTSEIQVVSSGAGYFPISSMQDLAKFENDALVI